MRMEQLAGSGLLFGISGTVQKVAEDGTFARSYIS